MTIISEPHFHIAKDTPDQEADHAGCFNLIQAMREKLQKKREEGRGGWHDSNRCNIFYLKELLRNEMNKAQPDMVDVANYAMMIYNREQIIQE